MFEPFRKQFTNELALIREAGMWKEEAVIRGPQGPEIRVGSRALLNFCSNDYLGLAASPLLAAVGARALKEHGFGMASVRFIAGTGVIHKELEAAITRFFGMEDAILYTSCFDANGGIFETLLGEGDAVFSDELNHASIIDGIRLSKAERFRFRHADMNDLEAQLKQAGPRRRRMIVTDGVFSMDGEVAPLRGIADLADRYEALVMVDDSHGSGVLGSRGRGSIEEAGVMERIDILTSTFGKALGGASGGFAAGKREIIEYLRQRSRPYLFSNTLPTVVAAVARYVLDEFDARFAERRPVLIENTRYFRKGLLEAGYTLGGDGAHPITPVLFSLEGPTGAVARALFEQGIYVRGFTYPVVPKGKARIRVQLSASHTRDHLDRALAAWRAVRIEAGIIS